MAENSVKNGKTVWFLVHRQELLKQTIDTFGRFNIPTDKILIGMRSLGHRAGVARSVEDAEKIIRGEIDD